MNIFNPIFSILKNGIKNKTGINPTQSILFFDEIKKKGYQIITNGEVEKKFSSDYSEAHLELIKDKIKSLYIPNINFISIELRLDFKSKNSQVKVIHKVNNQNLELIINNFL